MNYFLRVLIASLALLTLVLLWMERQTQLVSDAATSSVRGATTSDCSSVATPSLTPVQQERPPLSSLVDLQVTNPRKIKGDVGFLMQFAIIGHPKTATTFTMEWLAEHEEIQMYTHELHALQSGHAAEFAQLMYDLPAGTNYKRGYKAPRDICNTEALDLIAKYWPQSKLIVGLRHPVLWWESFYNFRVRHGYKMPLADSKLFIGACRPETHGVCTNESLFHHHLSLLGKTNMTGSELALFLPSPPPKRPHQPLPNKVFLYEISQLYEEPYADTYRKDLADFLELHSPLPPITKTGSSSKSKVKAVDICEDKFIKLRAVLMENAMAASTWILRHFVDHPDVTVSNPEQFRAIMHTWMKDPCDARQK